eukprot:TRINITY_DN3602_c3_g1_i1.p1 TRINITY_DN3602_c3_g1~~TRINITY_DN3602_c3_g1_i1.p1  ORF type:complete len:195 (+),score=25.17 TRINITY_DN3602_c3_g1_i1:74-658(+)
MDSLFSMFQSVFRYMGIFNQKRGKILFLGLDNAGKTSMLSMMTTGKMTAARPTNHPTNEQFSVGGVKVNAYDLGGHENGRILWSQYYTKVDGIVFMVDAADISRLSTVKVEIDKLLSDPDLARVPMVIIGNKIDIPSALGRPQLEYCLGLEGLCTGLHGNKTQARPLEIFMASISKRIGYGEAVKWIADYLADA